MQKHNLIHKLNTKILCVLILFVLIYITAGFVPQTLNISYGATYTYTKNSNNLPSDFEQKLINLINLYGRSIVEEYIEKELFKFVEISDEAWSE